MKILFLLACVSLVSACNSNTAREALVIPQAIKTVGSIEILDKEALSFLAENTRINIRGEGYSWTEGPVWIARENYLLFSDIPNNLIAKYDPANGTSVYLRNSGYTGLNPDDDHAGSNGLLVNQQGQLVLLQHGDRRISTMNAPFSSPKAKYQTLTDRYMGKRLNSPNDAVFHSDGSLYFTDPPYGLKNGLKDTKKELDFNGVYRLDKNGVLSLLDKTLTYPNGIGLSPDEKTLYVAVSDMNDAKWFAYDVNSEGLLENKRTFYEVTDLVNEPGEQGLPDGLVVHSSGVIFATGPGGVWLFDKNAKVLAKIRTGQATSNCTLTPDEKHLFITADDFLMSVSLK